MDTAIAERAPDCRCHPPRRRQLGRFSSDGGDGTGNRRRLAARTKRPRCDGRDVPARDHARAASHYRRRNAHCAAPGDDGDGVRVRRQGHRPENRICEPDAFRVFADRRPDGRTTASRKLTSDPFTAVVTLTHVEEIDDEALTLALKSPCRYIGSLGSRKTHAKRVARLKSAGFSDMDVARIHAPIGLDIAAETPGEIATSILAEIIATFRKAPAA